MLLSEDQADATLKHPALLGGRASSRSAESRRETEVPQHCAGTGWAQGKMELGITQASPKALQGVAGTGVHPGQRPSDIGTATLESTARDLPGEAAHVCLGKTAAAPPWLTRSLGILSQ